MGEAYNIGDLVWAKMKGFSPWPGRVIEPVDNVKKPTKKESYFIHFFGSDNFAWMEKNNLKSYFLYKDRLIKQNKKSVFKEAVDAIEKYIETNNITPPDIKKEEIEEETQTPPPKVKVKEKTPKSKSETPKATKRSLDGSKKTSSEKRHKPMKSKKESVGKSSLSIGNSPSTKSRISALLDRPSYRPKPTVPQIDIKCISQTLKDKKIEPSKLQFGFLGLGIMGSGIVKNLINSGHSVMVWNRSPEKCSDFVQIGAKHMMTPSDVINMADITFSCVSDPQVAKNMVFGNCGVLQEMNSDKGYVEMTGIDAETSKDISEAISGKGGRYLEAQVQGSQPQAEEGTLVILAAGDRSLFDDCQSCFQAMGKNSFYLGDVGNASKMNLVLQVMTGISVAALAEGMALADRAGLQQKDVLEVMELTSLSCPLLVEKAKTIIKGEFPAQLPLQHMQKDLRLSVQMGDTLEQPLILAASAVEVYKHAKRLGYGEHDVSSVYIRTRF